jgi:hypothetical protein
MAGSVRREGQRSQALENNGSVQYRTDVDSGQIYSLISPEVAFVDENNLLSSLPLQFPWQRSYLGALVGDPAHLQHKVDLAETEIFGRLTHLNGDPRDAEEVQAIRDALNGLAALKQELRDSNHGCLTGREPSNSGSCGVLQQKVP